MKALPTKVLSALACLFIVTLLAGCATQSSKETAQPAGLKSQYMYQTERNAQAAMVTVYWVHPPSSESLQKLKEDDDN
jgi:uncharacterized lipoprotein YajG